MVLAIQGLGGVGWGRWAVRTDDLAVPGAGVCQPDVWGWPRDPPIGKGGQGGA